ncbi:MAG: hypothetical protein Q9208_003319 [Pyrenodesmia sp. 3 TL-2023]
MYHSLNEDYYILVTHIVAGPKSLSYLIPFILLPTALCIPPSKLSKWQLASFFFPLIVAFQIHAWSCMEGVDVISVNLTQWSLVLLVCYDPRSAFRRLRSRLCNSVDSAFSGQAEKDDQPEYVEEAYPGLLRDRIAWVLTLLVSLRLSNWKIGDPSHDRKQPVRPMTRTKFFQYALFLAVQSFVILDMTSTWARYDPYFHTPGMSLDDPWQDATLQRSAYLLPFQKLPPRLVRTTVLAGQAYACITQGGSLPILPIIGLNAIGFWPDEWSPHTWPIFFGPFSAVGEKGLRGLWGTWWHQTNRYLSTPGHSLAPAVGMPTRSTLGYMMQVVSAFSLSGVMHMGLIPPRPRGTAMTAMGLRISVASFFWAQILGIGIELCISRLIEKVLGRLGPSLLWKSCTLLWIMLWLSYTLPFLAIPFRELGYWKQPVLPISLINRLSGGDWWVWS